jgi:hypothetical protein
MTYTDKEKKLIALAMNGAAAAGEIANGAVAFFKSLRKRRVRYADMTEDHARLNLDLLEQLTASQVAVLQLMGQVATVTAERDKEAENCRDMTKQFWDKCEYFNVRMKAERDRYLEHLAVARKENGYDVWHEWFQAKCKENKELKHRLSMISILVDLEKHSDEAKFDAIRSTANGEPDEPDDEEEPAAAA